MKQKMINFKENISTTAEIDNDNFERGKLQQMGGLGKAVVVFGGQEKFGELIQEMNLRVGG